MTTKYAALDLETAALSAGPFTAWEAAYILCDDDEGDREYVWHIRPDLRVAEPGALKIGGYYRRYDGPGAGHAPGTGKLIKAPKHDDGDGPGVVMGHAEVAGMIARHLASRVLIGANVGSFDVPHLDAYLRAGGECGTWDYHHLDIGSMVKGWAHGHEVDFPDGPLKLDAALRRCGLDPADYEAHTALGDARAARDAFDVVTGRSR